VKEIIVVDNGSTDGTGEYVSKNFSGVKVVYEKIPGINPAREKGFRESKGNIVIFVDADTKLPPNWTSRAVKVLRSSKNIVAVSGPYHFDDLTNPFHKILLWLAEVFVFVNAWISDRVFTWNTILKAGDMAIKREALEKIGGFDPEFKFYREDVDTAKKLLKHGRVVYVWSLMVESSARRFKKTGVVRQMWNYFFQHWMGILSDRPWKKKDDEPR
jgi:GT2 family glycosyltransferase